MHDVAISRENPKCFTAFAFCKKKLHPCNNIYIKHDAVKLPSIEV